jgi:isochorismate pyruvate lyase
MKKIKTANQCESLVDIRDGIDYIDKEIIHLLGRRMSYVLNAAQFKPNIESIPAPERVSSMLAKRKEWAQMENLNEDFIVPLYSQIIQWFIQQQITFWKNKKIPTALDNAI